MPTARAVADALRPFDNTLDAQRLAEIYQKSGRSKEAEALQDDAVATFTRVLGEKHPLTIDAVATGPVERFTPDPGP